MWILTKNSRGTQVGPRIGNGLHPLLSDFRLWSRNGWESTPQTYTHFKEGIKGYKTSYRTLSNSYPVKSYRASSEAGRLHGVPNLWGSAPKIAAE